MTATVDSVSRASRAVSGPWFSAEALAVLLVVALATFGVYAHGFSNALVFDDARLTDGVVGQYGSLWPWRQRLLSYGSFVWAGQLFGVENFAAQRVLNVLLHLATAAAIYVLTRQLLALWQRDAPQEEEQDGQAPALRLRAAALVAAGWFALNPAAVYAVGYLVQRPVVMLTLFTVLFCIAWLRALQAGAAPARMVWGIAAALAAALAFLSKEHGVLVPLLAVPLYVYARRPSARVLLAVAGVAVLLVAGLAALLWERFGGLVGAASFDETSAAYVRQLDALRPGAAGQVYALSVLNQARLFFDYAWLWLAPYVGWMSIDIRPAFPASFASPLHLAGALAFVALTLASLWALLARRDGWSLLGLCVLCAVALFGTEFVTTWIQDPFVLYRSYLWAFALPVILALLLALSGLSRRTIYVAGAVAGAVLAAQAFERVGSFKNEFTVWDDAAAKIDLKAPANAFGRWRPFQNRGAYFLEHGNTSAALFDFDRAAALAEPLGSAQFSRGMALQVLGRYQESLQAFGAAEKQGFTSGALYYQAGVSLRAQGQLQHALTAFAQALQKQPDAVTREHALLAQAETATALRRFDLARQSYQTLLQDHDAENGKYLVGLAVALMAQQQYEQAHHWFARALSLREDPAAYYGRALLHIQQGNAPAALEDAQQAVRLAPGNRTYAGTLEKLRADAGRKAQ